MSAVQSFTSSTDLIEWLMQEEREALKSYHAKATRVDDPRLQVLLNRLAEIRSRSIAELESEVSEIRSQAEITTQINAMFW